MDEQDHGLSARRGPAGPSDVRASAHPTRGEEARLERLSAYLDGWVDDRDRAAVEQELASDPEARGVLDDLRLVRLALGDLKAPRAPRSFALSAALPRRDPFALFRRLEWATRGAAGVAALAFAVALVSAPQVSETVTSAAPAALAQQSAPSPAAEAPQTAGARERDTQTLDAVIPAAAAGAAAAAPALAPTIPATATPAPPPATRGVVPAPEPAPASPAAGTPPPAPMGTPAPSAPTLLAAPSPTATGTPSAPAGSAATPIATVEATRLAVAPPAAPVVTAPPPDAITPTVAPAPDIPAARKADGANAPAPTVAPVLAPASTPAVEPVPGTTLPVATSEESGEADLAPALGVLAGLLTVLALVERVAVRRRQG